MAPPTLVIKLWLKNKIFIFSSSSLKPPADGASYYVCSNGGATYVIGEIIAKDNLNIENLMQTIENLLLQTCTFTKWKLILSNNEDNNNNIDIINNKNNNDNNNNKNDSVTSSVRNSWICFTFLNVFSVKCWSMFNFFLAHLLRAYAIHVPVANLSVQSSMFNFFFSSPVESLCHTCTRGIVNLTIWT